MNTRSIVNKPIEWILIAMAVAGAPLGAADWPGYLGPNRDGSSAEEGLFRDWPSEGPEVLWRRPIGMGYSGTAVVDGRLFTLFVANSKEYAGAFDAATGTELWRTQVGRNRADSYGGGPRSTPMVDGERVFVFGASAQLTALDTATGAIEWRHDLRKEMGARVPEWGVSSSPLIDGDLLIVQVGGSKRRAFVAFDKRSGTTVWSAGNDLPAYASPIVATIANVRQAIFFGATKISGIAIRDGRELWNAPWVTRYDVNAATPIFVPMNGVMISSGYDRGAALLQIALEGDTFKVYQLWQNRVMRNHFNTSVRINQYVYGFDDIIFKCIDLLSGKEQWRGRAGSKGSVIHADGLLFVLGGDGRLSLVNENPDAFEPIADARLMRDKTWAAPALANGVLFIRGTNEMVAVRVGPSRATDVTEDRSVAEGLH